VRSAETLALNEGCGVRTHARDLVGNSPMIRPDDDRKRRARAVRCGIEYMRQQRLARHRMQHFWQRGPHPRALAGRKYYRQAGSSRHRNPLLIERGYAVI
jgi:hypothetical protein